MAFWLIVIFLMGLMLSFFPQFLQENDLVWCFGVVIMFVAVGLGLRAESFRRRGVREKLAAQVKSLEEKMAEARAKFAVDADEDNGPGRPGATG